MNNFTISQLQQLSSIKAHTIRIWEQRYGALTPNRSDGNTRSYDNEQLKRLLNIVSLLAEGYKISQLGPMYDAEIHALLALKLKNSTSNEGQNEYYISQLIASAMSYDEVHFDTIYTQCLNLQGLRNTYSKVLYPMLKRMGLMWGIDSISAAQEHFSSNLIKQKMFSAIDALPAPTNTKKTWCLFLPENEFHEIALLFSYYLIKEAGCKVIYLGSNLPLETLKKSLPEINPANLLFFFVHSIKTEAAESYINDLSQSLKKAKIYFSGNERFVSKLDIDKQINLIQSPEDLLQAISENK